MECCGGFPLERQTRVVRNNQRFRRNFYKTLHDPANDGWQTSSTLTVWYTSRNHRENLRTVVGKQEWRVIANKLSGKFYGITRFSNTFRKAISALEASRCIRLVFLVFRSVRSSCELETCGADATVKEKSILRSHCDLPSDLRYYRFGFVPRKTKIIVNKVCKISWIFYISQKSSFILISLTPTSVINNSKSEKILLLWARLSLLPDKSIPVMNVQRFRGLKKKFDYTYLKLHAKIVRARLM